MASTFHGSFDADVAIPAPHCGPGGTMNFNFGSSPTDGQKRRIVPFSTIPFAPDPDFVDRPAILAWVRDKCAGAGARAALVGLGGVGKSQLAIQYAHSIRDASSQTFVFWVHASTRARFEEAYRDIAERLQLPGRSDPKANVLRLVSEWLRDEANGRWVMVLDNVDDVETFFPSRKRQRDNADASEQTPLATYVPQSRNGAILVTSRSKDAAVRLAGGHNKTKEVLAMGEDEGLQLLRKKLDDALIEESAVELLRALDCIPLAISQAAAYINRRARMTIAGYLREFQRNSKKQESLLNWDAGELRRDTSASNSVVTTWQMSFEQIQRERQSAAELLSLMSFFNPQGIPESTLRRYSRDATGATSADNKEDKEDEEEADSAFDEDLDMLQAYSLVSMTADNDACEMHALVQFCMRVWLSSFGNAEQWEQRFVALMAQELPSGEYKNWAKCQQLFPHVEPLFNAESTAKESLKAWAHILTNAAWYLRERGSYSVAEQLNRRALEGREKELGERHPDTLTSVYCLAHLLHTLRQYAEAAELYQQACDSRTEQLGPNHPRTIACRNHFAALQQEADTSYCVVHELEKMTKWCYARAVRGPCGKNKRSWSGTARRSIEPGGPGRSRQATAVSPPATSSTRLRYCTVTESFVHFLHEHTVLASRVQLARKALMELTFAYAAARHSSEGTSSCNKPSRVRADSLFRQRTHAVIACVRIADDDCHVATLLMVRPAGAPHAESRTWPRKRALGTRSAPPRPQHFTASIMVKLDEHDKRRTYAVRKTAEDMKPHDQGLWRVLFQISPIVLDLVVAMWYITHLFDAYMAFVLFSMGFAYTCIGWYFTTLSQPTKRDWAEKQRTESSTVNEMVRNWQTVAYFNRLTYEHSRYAASIASTVRAQYAYHVRSMGGCVAQDMLMVSGFAACCVLGMRQIVAGRKQVGDLVTLIMYWRTMTSPLHVLSNSHRLISSSLINAERLLQLLNTKPSVADREGARDLVVESGVVEFMNVEFAYDERKPIIRGVDLRAEGGQTIAFVGATGGGKSTMLKLLFRFYDVTGGTITIDGQDLRSVTQTSLRDVLGLVPQDPVLFNQTIRENVRYARLDATDAEVEDACRAAAVHDDIVGFPDGYSSKVGERGVRLSGGQLQRIAIARVFLKRPKIVLLDEATSAIDSGTEALIQKAFRKLSKGRTTLVIAHRLSTIVDADQILVMEKGAIVERGTHGELIEKRGKYSELWVKQTAGQLSNLGSNVPSKVSSTSAGVDVSPLIDLTPTAEHDATATRAGGKEQ
ncbi:hypothetical protein OPT61_g4848 [Boeremia exigua]|uniref:Uncharacterized protein n=1 Tax=Boeremia exigua TaxID=749465 RepID=A0ACC2ICG3_9PLEO|nr:hypothetical protein OPT61_g4848 [Boeremia exigua]